MQLSNLLAEMLNFWQNNNYSFVPKPKTEQNKLLKIDSGSAFLPTVTKHLDESKMRTDLWQTQKVYLALNSVLRL